MWKTVREMSSRDTADLTVVQLKDKLRELGLPTAGSKVELVSRLMQADQSGERVANISEAPEMSVIQEDQSESEAVISMSQHEREIELYRREKEVAERELQLARRELELIRGMQQQQSVPEHYQARQESTSHDSSRSNIAAIADLFGNYDGSDFRTWEEQLGLLRITYHLSDGYIKILIGMRLKGKAAEWLHSRSRHIGLSADELLDELRKMYDHRPSKLSLRKRFEKRIWKREETFHQYVHEKIILAHQVPIDEDEIVESLTEFP